MTPRQSLFVAEYLADLNAKQAIRAGYAKSSAAEERARLVTEAQDHAARVEPARDAEAASENAPRVRRLRTR